MNSDEVERDLVPLMYDELRRVARRMLDRERVGHTLQPTALVHEAYLAVLGNRDGTFENRAHLFGAAAEAMRRILIDQARRRQRLKRGGGQARAELDVDSLPIEPLHEDVLAVDEALATLEAAHPEARQIVNLRYFAGFTIRETAEALGRSASSVEREWRFARAWLRNAIGDFDAAAPG